MFDDWFIKLDEKNANGTLTIGEARWGYYRLLEGEHAGKVVIKSLAKVAGEECLIFANSLTWISLAKLKDTRCEAVRPTFSSGTQEVDRSQAIWYTDNGCKMQFDW